MTRTMKDSGVEWIGEIPVDWKRTSLLNNLRTFITDGPHETPKLVDAGIPFISVDSLNDSEDIDLSVVKKFISKEDYNLYQKKTHLEKGDILFSKSATIGKTAILKSEKCMVWSPIAVIKPNNERCLTKYLYYILNCENAIKYASLQGSYNTQINLGMRTLEKIYVPVPPLSEQQKIAAFLDEKCGAIDEIISKTEQSIEEYKKLKQSVITKAVTKGIRQNRPMQDSNIEWIGEIPTDWNVRKIFQLFNQVKNKNIGMTENNLLSLSYGKIKKKNIETSFGLLPESFETYNIIEKDDIVLRLTDLQNDHRSLRVGLCKERGIITSAYVTIRLKDKQYAPYLYYLLHTFDIKKGFYGMGDGVRQGLNWDELKHLSLVLPLFDEQKEIADYLDKKCAEIDTLIEKKQQFLSEMANYRKSLIYEYVTGKKEVA